MTSFSMRVVLAGIAFSLPLAFSPSTQAGPEFFPLGAANEKNETVIVVSDRLTEFSLDGRTWSPGNRHLGASFLAGPQGSDLDLAGGPCVEGRGDVWLAGS